MRAATKARIARAFTRATGFELRRARRPRVPVQPPPKPPRPPKPAPPPKPKPRIEVAPPPPDPGELAARAARVRPGDRLLTAPVFVLSSVRSGSTLLRLILDTHSQICAPHELHLRRITSKVTARFGRIALEHLDLDERDLRYLLWDRLLHLILQRSGKQLFVNKTPNDAFIWGDIVSCWPDARFIFLHRNPAAMLDSWDQAMADLTRDEAARDILSYAVAMEQARSARGGLVVRYEDLVGDPEKETRRICEYLGVPWEASMLDYGAVEHSGMRRGLGDWSEKVRSGSVQATAADTPLPAVPDVLRPIAEAWNYLPESEPRQPPEHAPGPSAP